MLNHTNKGEGFTHQTDTFDNPVLGNICPCRMKPTPANKSTSLRELLEGLYTDGYIQGTNNNADTRTNNLYVSEAEAAIEAYAERLAAKRAIEARIDELDGLFPEDSRTGEGYYSVPAKWLDEHYTALSASLTKEDKS